MNRVIPVTLPIPVSDPCQNLIHSQYYVNGAWLDAASKRTFVVTNPADQQVITRVADCGPEEAAAAINDAYRAQQQWRDQPAKARAGVLRKWFELIVTNADALAELLTLEQGKPLAEAKGEIIYGASFVEWFAEEAKRINGDVLPAPNKHQRIIVTKHAVGVCAIATPWNFPIAMITRKAAAALAAGCAVIVKPAAETPLSALALAHLAEQAGLSAGLFNVLTTRQPEPLFAELLKSPLVRKVSFTGSTPIGKHLMRQAADTVKKVSLELGGNAPFIVFDDADLEQAVTGALASKYRNAGQTCVCANRFFIQRGIYQRFTQRFVEEVAKLQVGDGRQPGVTIGPLINEAAIRKVEEHIHNALTLGAKLQLGGHRLETDALFFQPTILTDATTDMLINREETFGPVAALIPFDTEAQVIHYANDTQYGLASYLYTQNLGCALRVSDALEYGMVGVNEGIISNEIAPFGGVKESGLGREGSKYGIDEYLEIKYTLLGGL